MLLDQGRWELGGLWPPTVNRGPVVALQFPPNQETTSLGEAKLHMLGERPKSSNVVQQDSEYKLFSQMEEGS